RRAGQRRNRFLIQRAEIASVMRDENAGPDRVDSGSALSALFSALFLQMKGRDAMRRLFVGLIALWLVSAMFGCSHFRKSKPEEGCFPPLPPQPAPNAFSQ